MRKINVKAEVFKFYVDNYRLPVDELALKTKISKEQLEAWCNNDSAISLSALRKIAAVYQKHWGIFLIKEKTSYFKAPKNLRRTGSAPYNLDAMLAFEESYRILDISKSLGDTPLVSSISESWTKSLSAESTASEARKILGVSKEVQFGWKNQEAAYKYLKNELEKNGVIVSEQSIAEENLDGFAVINENRGIVTINRPDRSVSRKTFTLLHEFCHILKNLSASCETEEYNKYSPQEVFAEDFAGYFLLPPVLLNVDPVMKRIVSDEQITDKDYEYFSKQYSVSLSAVAVRFKKLGLINQSELDNKLQTFRDMYLKSLQEKKRKMKESNGFDPKYHTRKAVNRMGEKLTNNIYQKYTQDILGIRETAALLNVNVGQLAKIGEFIGYE